MGQARRFRYLSLAATTATIALASFSTAIAADENAPSASSEIALRSFATPYLLRPNARNITCYISNVGTHQVEIKNFALRNPLRVSDITATTCGNPSSFRLNPGKSCYIGTTPTESGDYACLAQSTNVFALRGSMELRDADARVLAAIAMSVGRSAGTAADEFETIASTPMFGGPGQDTVSCKISNVGTDFARVRGVRLVSSTGTEYPASTQQCRDRNFALVPVGSLRPQGVCTFALFPAPRVDLQCRGQVTRKADVRGILLLTDSSANPFLNEQPLE